MRNPRLATGVVLLVLALAGCDEGFSVTGVSPPVGVVTGGEPVQIEGTGFRSDIGFTVYIGGAKCDNVVVAGSKALTVTTPSAAKEGAVDVRVTTDNGIDLALPKAFKYVEKASADMRDLGVRKSLRQKPE
ncbi:MAG: IPT/TIG domain-containing protein [Deltaproteobacteria bacterium]|nr:IPT/TIG domain-containing protein [Deltaproteobacteria bacterium]